MIDNIECKAGVTFLRIEVFGESSHLNPFRINTDQIRHIREYTDSKGGGWAVVVGQKMYPTRDLKFDDFKVGNVVEIGNTKFECAITTSLTERDSYKTLINYKNVLYTRKYLKKDKTDGNGESYEKSDKFAIITVDERIIPIIEELTDVRSNNESGSTREGAPATA